MSFPFSTPRPARLTLLAAVAAAGLSAAPALAGDTAVPDLSAFMPPAAIGHDDRLVVAQSREAAQLQVQIQQMQEQVRDLTGQVQGLQFQLTQLQTLLERMTEDYELRFQALEGGAVGKPQAATESGGAMPTEELPQQQQAMPPVETGSGEPMHGDAARLPEGLAESLDPLVGNSDPGADATLGSLPMDELPPGTDRPLDLSLDGGTPADGDAEAQYAAGYDAIVRGDYAFAEDQFQQFVALYPDNPHAPDATNWLGEALIQRGAFDDAALVLAEGYQKYSGSERAPDLLLKLGVALAGAGEPEVACRTFATLEERFPTVAPAFAERLAAEKRAAQCPA